jgi:MoaA/NifB/PqqE/SkfB family radical SAM enzyme
MECSTFAELDLAEFGAVLQAQIKGRRIPLSGMFELTERCNLNCVHCYVNQPASSRVARARELTTDQVKRILDQAADAGCLFLTLTGGEPLLRPDFIEIYLHARKRGILASIFTNGTHVDTADC